MKCTILVLLSIAHICSVLAEANENQTKLEPTKHDTFSRRVRALIFPSKAAVLLTAALTKIIVGGRPTGLQYSLEFDMYVPLPDTIDGWRPKILPQHTTKAPAVSKPNRRWNGERVYVGHNITGYSNPDRNYMSYYEPYESTQYHGYAKPQTHKDYFYRSPWQLTTEPWHRPRQQHNFEDETYESWAEVPAWKLNRDYRERRQIFDQLETMGNFFNMDISSCIKRAICELKAKFNEQHQNRFLMEDVLRIILTLPEDIADDKYQHRINVRHCAQFYAVSCPYNLLNFLTQNTEKSKAK